MKKSFHLQTLFYIFRNYHNIELYTKKVILSKSLNTKVNLLNLQSRTYIKPYDYNFSFLHQNPTYNKHFFQLPLNVDKKFYLTGKNLTAIENFILEHKIKDFTKDEVIKIMKWIINNVSVNPTKSFPVWTFLDNKCANFVHNLSLNESLYIFDMWYVLLHHKAFQTQYFAKVIDVWFQNFDSMDKSHVLQVLYYLGNYKKIPTKMIVEKLSTVENKMCEMSNIEFGIVCLCLFKLKIKSVSDTILKKAVNVAHNFIATKENFHLISILKFLRQIQYHDQTLYDSLYEYIMKEENSFNFVECTNFLATFSTLMVYRNDLYEILEQVGFKMLQQEIVSSSKGYHYHPSLRCRVKDISRYLWAMVNVGHQIRHDTIEVILSIINERYSLSEYEIQPHILTDCLQSLAIINIYPDNLIKYVFTEKFVSKLKSLKKDKPLHQMFFLYKSLEIERPDLIKWVKLGKSVLSSLKPVPKNLDSQLEKRTSLSNVLSIIKQSEIPENNVKLCCSLPHIVILGLEVLWNTGGTGSNNTTLFHIEVLDSEVHCYDSHQIIGLMLTKLRHLNKLNCAVIVLNDSDINHLNKMPSQNQSQELQKMFRTVC